MIRYIEGPSKLDDSIEEEVKVIRQVLINNKTTIKSKRKFYFNIAFISHGFNLRTMPLGTIFAHGRYKDGYNNRVIIMR